jgi:hypothetical protein
MKLSEAVAAYVAYKRSLGMRFATETRSLKSFWRALGDVDVREVQADRVHAYLAGNGPITSFWHRKLSALRGFYRFALARGYATCSPLPLIVPEEPQAFAPYIYSRDEIKRLLAATAGRERYLAAVGTLALRHAQWDCVLRMTVKSIKGIDILTAFSDTERWSSRRLRNYVVREAKNKLADTHSAVAELQALLDQGERLTEDRNLLIHSVVAMPLDSREEFLMTDEKLRWSKRPTAADLLALAREVAKITNKLNDARLTGFLHAAPFTLS